MTKSLDFDPCGIEVSARTLVVERRRPGQPDAVREFANTAAGHQAFLGWLQSASREIRSARSLGPVTLCESCRLQP